MIKAKVKKLTWKESIIQLKKNGFGMFKNLRSFSKEDKFKGQLEWIS